MRSAMFLVAAGLTALALHGCTAASSTNPIDPDMTRDEARALGGKSDHIDLCEWLGWYGDGICDEFCPRPDPDCEAECRSDYDCAPIYCFRAPCPVNVCVRGECLVDFPEDDCDPGERECAMCYGRTMCVPQSVSCPLLHCPPRTHCGGIAGRTCADGFYCDWADDSCGATDRLGSCEPIPDAWIEIYAPVCGCDGVTYGNEGEAHGHGVDVAHEGECEEPPPPPPGECVVAGCSSQLCVDPDIGPLVSTCEWLPQYACYRDATCERQPDGTCGWTPTPELMACLASPPS